MFPAKPLLNRLLLKNANKGQSPGNLTSKTSNKVKPLNLWAEETSQIIWSTPKRGRDIQESFAMFGHEGSDKPIHSLLGRKLSKALDEKNMLLTEAQVKIRSLEAQLKTARPKKRRAVKLSPNSRFATIGDIQRAGSTEEIDESESEASDESSSIVSCIVVEN